MVRLGKERKKERKERNVLLKRTDAQPCLPYTLEALPKTLFSPMNNVGTLPNTLHTFPSTLGTFPNTLRNFLSNKQDTLPNTLCCDFLKKSGLTPFPPFFQTCYKIYGWSRGGGGVWPAPEQKKLFLINTFLSRF